jgi:hypothetical protein
VTGRNTVRLMVGLLLGVVAAACWLWAIGAVVFNAGPAVFPFVLGLVLLGVAGVLVWKGSDTKGSDTQKGT